MNNSYQAYNIVRDASGVVQAVLASLPMVPLATGQVSIKIHYSSLNYKDALAVTNKGKILRRLPLVPGIDAAGVVHASLDARFREGDPVLVTGCGLGEDHDGGYAQYLMVPADWVIPLPAGLSLRESMILGTAGFTAALAVQRMEENHQHPEMGPVVVTGASGGVGGLAIALLKKMGYTVVALTSHLGNEAYLRALGTDEVLVMDVIPGDGRPLESARWAGAIDTLGGDALAWLTRNLMPWGNIASIGLAAGVNVHTTVMPFIIRGVSVLGINSAHCPTAWRHRLWARLAGEMRLDNLETMVHETITLSQLPDYAARLLANSFHGRVLVQIAP